MYQHSSSYNRRPLHWSAQRRLQQLWLIFDKFRDHLNQIREVNCLENSLKWLHVLYFWIDYEHSEKKIEENIPYPYKVAYEYPAVHGSVCTVSAVAPSTCTASQNVLMPPWISAGGQGSDMNHFLLIFPSAETCLWGRGRTRLARNGSFSNSLPSLNSSLGCTTKNPWILCHGSPNRPLWF